MIQGHKKQSYTCEVNLAFYFLRERTHPSLVKLRQAERNRNGLTGRAPKGIRAFYAFAVICQFCDTSSGKHQVQAKLSQADMPS